MPIPAADPLGLPAPAWLLQGLLVLTWALHILAVGLALGGCALAAATGLAARGDPEAWQGRLARSLFGMLPIVMSFTITLGVAPLLFLQVLYGTLFYPATILMAWPWMGVLGLMLAGYGLLYLLQFRPGMSPWWGGLAVLLFLGAAFLFGNAVSLMAMPEEWQGLYAASQAGLHLAPAGAAVLPKLVHVALGAVAAGGLLAVLLADLAGERAGGGPARRRGLAWLAVGAVAQLAAGPWLLMSLRPGLRAELLGQGLTLGLLALAAALGLAAPALAAAGGAARRPAAWSAAAAGALLVATGALAILRHWARQQAVAPYLRPDAWRVVPQTAVFVLFAITLLAALGVLALMGLRVRAARRAAAART